MAEKKMNILLEEVNGENIQDVIANSSKVRQLRRLLNVAKRS